MAPSYHPCTYLLIWGYTSFVIILLLTAISIYINIEYNKLAEKNMLEKCETVEINGTCPEGEKSICVPLELYEQNITEEDLG